MRLSGLGCDSHDEVSSGCSCQVARRLAEAYHLANRAA